MAYFFGAECKSLESLSFKLSFRVFVSLGENTQRNSIDFREHHGFEPKLLGRNKGRWSRWRWS